MSKNISDSRKQQLEELKNFTDAVNKEITNIVRTLDWTMESTMANIDKEYFICPYDPSHQLTEGSFNDHLVSCQWKTEGYGKSDIPLSEPILSTDSPFSIKFDEKLQDEILRKAKEQNPAMQTGIGERLIPRTSDRLLTDFTSDERKALYDYVISNTAKPDIGQDIADIGNLKHQEKEDKKLSFLELLVQERNLKRRRAKHKGVHTNKKSHVEIIRELINQQMEIYTDYMLEQNNSDHVQTIEPDDSSYEAMQDRTEHLYKIFHTSSQNYDDMHSRERNDHYKRDDLKREDLEEKNYHRSRDRDRQEKYSDETYRKHRRTEYMKSSHSRDRKSHKKNKRRSRNRHKDKHHEKKHKSQDRDKSSERHSKHSDHKRKKKNKDY
ncbi:U11/U12 small nuclear ribonucleoprotein 48 kDa protein-like [Formica exsecta]|uniref:U11/U12 small nuclear ribonucleoprotein 48 kDa protein-like n=1 Tax=Formica exsecta TaxID=72781 RepID=UPI001142FFB5|nr:U11/U12 small nuclear ribonucleoprotein 48 kDa protein-like [Formica exsecta]